MGGGVSAVAPGDDQPQSLSPRSGEALSLSPRSLNSDKFQKTRMVFTNEFAKRAYVHFLRDEEGQSCSNYFKDFNFATVTSGELEANEASPVYPSVEPYFDNITEEDRRDICNRSGSCVHFAKSLERAYSFLLLLTAIDNIDRFELSMSYQIWLETEKSPFTDNVEISDVFSFHSTRRTKTMNAADMDALAPALDSRDWLFVLKECLGNIPIATVLCRYFDNRPGSCRVVDCSDAYTKMFKKGAHELYGKKLNLLKCSSEQKRFMAGIIENKMLSKMVLKIKVDKQMSSVAVASIPITDLSGACQYMLFVCCDTSSSTFCIDELKIVADFVDILPQRIQMRSKAQQDLLFPRPQTTTIINEYLKSTNMDACNQQTSTSSDTMDAANTSSSSIDISGGFSDRGA
jgi:hypothetical protein